MRANGLSSGQMDDDCCQSFSIQSAFWHKLKFGVVPAAEIFPFS